MPQLRTCPMRLRICGQEATYGVQDSRSERQASIRVSRDICLHIVGRNGFEHVVYVGKKRERRLWVCLLENTGIRFVHLNVSLPMNDENGLYVPLEQLSRIIREGTNQKSLHLRPE